MRLLLALLLIAAIAAVTVGARLTTTELPFEVWLWLLGLVIVVWTGILIHDLVSGRSLRASLRKWFVEVLNFISGG